MPTLPKALCQLLSDKPVPWTWTLITGYSHSTLCRPGTFTTTLKWNDTGWATDPTDPNFPNLQLTGSLSVISATPVGNATWKASGNWVPCGSGSTDASGCPPISGTGFGFALLPSCCPIDPVGEMHFYEGEVEGSSIPIALCPECTSYPCPPGCSCDSGSGGGGGAGCNSQTCQTAARFSSEPVRYATGEIRLDATDVLSTGFGRKWGHRRSLHSRLSSSETLGNGFNWKVAEWPYLVIQTSPYPATLGNVTTVIAMGRPDDTLWFDAVGSGFVARFGLKHTLVLDAVNGVYRLTYPDGTVVIFNSGNGTFEQQINPGGDAITVMAYHANGFNIAKMQRSFHRLSRRL